MLHLLTSVSKGTGRVGAAVLSALFLNPGSPHSVLSLHLWETVQKKDDPKAAHSFTV